MKKLIILAAVAATFAGCRVIKVKRSADGEYRAYYNSHWFTTEADAVTADLSPDGKFALSLSGIKSNPSEEFNKTMQTYTTAFVTLAQIAAAAYNPSASAAAAKTSDAAPVTVNVMPAATNATTCADGTCAP